MKKVLAICALAFAMVACNNEASTAEDAAKKTADSIHQADSMKMEAEKMAQDTMNKMVPDSAANKMMADSTKK